MWWEVRSRVRGKRERKGEEGGGHYDYEGDTMGQRGDLRGAGKGRKPI